MDPFLLSMMVAYKMSSELPTHNQILISTHHSIICDAGHPADVLRHVGEERYRRRVGIAQRHDTLQEPLPVRGSERDAASTISWPHRGA